MCFSLGAGEIGDFEDDPDLMNVPEAEAWSVTVDKKTLKKMSAKDIKRQDHIWGKITSSTLTFFTRVVQYMGSAHPQLCPPNLKLFTDP